MVQITEEAVKEIDPYKEKGKVEIIKGVEILELGYDQENGPKYKSVDELKAAGYIGFKSQRELIKTLTEPDFDGKAEYLIIEEWFTSRGKPMVCGMTLDEMVETFGKDNIVIGNPSKDIYTNRIFYDVIAIKVNEDGIGLYQTYLTKSAREMILKPFSLTDIEQFI